MEQTKADIENEKEWRRIMFKEIREVRKDLQGFKLKMTAFVSILVAAIECFSRYIK